MRIDVSKRLREDEGCERRGFWPGIAEFMRMDGQAWPSLFAIGPCWFRLVRLIPAHIPVRVWVYRVMQPEVSRHSGSNS
jgi:hypothetical protein